MYQQLVARTIRKVDAMDDLRKNAEGYNDPPAYKAIKNCIGGGGNGSLQR